MVRDKIYSIGLSLMAIIVYALMFLDNPPWNWSVTQWLGAAIIGLVVVGLSWFLRATDRFALRHNLGEVRFKDGKVIDDE